MGKPKDESLRNMLGEVKTKAILYFALSGPLLRSPLEISPVLLHERRRRRATLRITGTPGG